MIQILLALLKSGGAKRFAVFLVTSLVVLLNKKLSLDLDPVQISAFVVAAVGYLLQSGSKAGKVEAAKINAEAAIVDAKTAANELGKSLYPADAPLRTP